MKEQISKRDEGEGVDSFYTKAMRMVFGEHLKEMQDVWSYPHAGRGAFSARSKKHPV